MQPNGVVLLSSGVDSTTCLAIAKEQGYLPYALSFRCGQRHTLELAAAERVARALGTPCGRCDSCLLRAKGFSEAGLADPALT